MIGKEHMRFLLRKVEKCKKAITEVITKNKLALFRTQSKQSSKPKMHVTALKNDCSLFSRLFISCQTRDGDLDRFFAHENQSAPPSLSFRGKIQSTTKSDLLKYLDLKAIHNLPSIDAKCLKGAPVVRMHSPGSAKTIQEYASKVFNPPHMLAHLKTADRIDTVWDIIQE